MSDDTKAKLLEWATGPWLAWECGKCGRDCTSPDNGDGRQEVDCLACGQRTILLLTDREGWLD